MNKNRYYFTFSMSISFHSVTRQNYLIILHSTTKPLQLYSYNLQIVINYNYKKKNLHRLLGISASGHQRFPSKS